MEDLNLLAETFNKGHEYVPMLNKDNSKKSLFILSGASVVSISNFS